MGFCECDMPQSEAAGGHGRGEMQISERGAENVFPCGTTIKLIVRNVDELVDGNSCDLFLN